MNNLFGHVAQSAGLCVLATSLLMNPSYCRAQQVPASTGARDILSGWDVSGSNTVHIDYFRVTGDETASPYFKKGFEPYDDLFVTFTRRKSPYDSWRGYFAGTVSDSPYRSQDKGIVPERFNLVREKGDAAVPYRAEFGDYFGFLSARTLQRTLKGFQLDLQPSKGVSTERHSIQVSTGFANDNYRDVDPGEDHFTALSWLAEHDRLGRIVANAVHNYREATADGGRSDHHQGVFSVALERAFAFGSNRLNFESEIAGFTGDYELGATDRRDRSDMGYFAQLSGRSDLPLTYDLRYAHYGEDYRPNGAAVTFNQRAFQAHASWRFENGLNLRGRAQRFTDNVEGGTSLNTETVGLTLSGPLGLGFLPELNGRIDSFFQDRTRRDRATDVETYSTRLNLSAPIGHGWSGRTELLGEMVSDKASTIDTITRQLRVTADRKVAMLGLEGSVSPGIVLRRVTGGASVGTDVGPSVALNLSDRMHRLNASYSYLSEDRDAAGTRDVQSHATAVAYHHRFGNHALGVELAYQRREPDSAEDTNSYRVALFWRFGFEWQQATAVPPTVTQTDLSVDRSFSPVAIRPGRSLPAARDDLAAMQIRGGTTLPGAISYEKQVFDGVSQRQRVVLLHENNRINKIAVIINLEKAGDLVSGAQVFERVRAALARRFGAPSRNFEEGRFTATLLADVNSGRLVRITEWDVEGNVLRLGIPRRLDREVRIEIHFAARHPPPSQSLWSLENVR